MTTKQEIKFPKFSRLFPEPITTLFDRLSQQKNKCNNDLQSFICQGSFHNNSSNITDHQHTMTITKIHETLFIWSLVVFMQIFDRTETILFVKNFPWGCTEFPKFSKFVEIPEYSGFSRFSMFVVTLKNLIKLWIHMFNHKQSFYSPHVKI